MRNPFLAALVLAVVASGPASAQGKGTGKGIQCWTDDKGKRMCGDRVPPQYAKKERQVFNSKGQVVETKSREKTPEEIAAEEAEKASRDQAEQSARKQAEYDKYLVQTFGTVKDLEGSRDTRLVTLDGRIGLAEKAVANDEAAMKTLSNQVDAAQQAGKPADPKLAKQVKDFDKSLADNRRALEMLRKERSHTETKFNADIARYRELRAGKG